MERERERFQEGRALRSSECNIISCGVGCFDGPVTDSQRGGVEVFEF